MTVILDPGDTSRHCGDKAKMSAAAARRASVAARERSGDRTISAYRCLVCARWHIGHTPAMRTVERLAARIRGIDRPDGDDR